MEQSSGSPSSISSRRNNRSAWFLNISKCEGSSEITINYKNTKGIVAPFSKSKSNANVKIAFGTPEKCDLVVSKDKDETYETLVFTSKRKETARFRVDTLNSFEGGVNYFSKKITSLVVELLVHQHKTPEVVDSKDKKLKI